MDVRLLLHRLGPLSSHLPVVEFDRAEHGLVECDASDDGSLRLHALQKHTFGDSRLVRVRPQLVEDENGPTAILSFSLRRFARLIFFLSHRQNVQKGRFGLVNREAASWIVR